MTKTPQTEEAPKRTPNPPPINGLSQWVETDSAAKKVGPDYDKSG